MEEAGGGVTCMEEADEADEQSELHMSKKGLSGESNTVAAACSIGSSSSDVCPTSAVLYSLSLSSLISMVCIPSAAAAAPFTGTTLPRLSSALSIVYVSEPSVSMSVKARAVRRC